MSAKVILLGTNFLLCITNIVFMLVVLGYSELWNMDPKIISIVSQSFMSFVGELNSLPLFAIWCAYSPQGLEATSITLFTGLMNLTANMSNYSGYLVLKMTNVDRENQEHIAKPLWIQNGYLMFISFLYLFIKFPQRSKKILKTPLAESIKND